MRGKRETQLREFFLKGLPTKESEFSLAKQRQRGKSTSSSRECVDQSSFAQRREEAIRFSRFAGMEANGLIDQDRLDGASNYLIWKERMLCLLDEHFLKTYVASVVVVPAHLDPLKKYKGEMAKTKRMILDGMKDHVVRHITSLAKGLPKRCGMHY